MQKIKVLITKAQPSMWYNALINQTIEVYETSLDDPCQNMYYCYNNNKIVFKCDVVVLAPAHQTPEE